MGRMPNILSGVSSTDLVFFERVSLVALVRLDRIVIVLCRDSFKSLIDRMWVDRRSVHRP